MRGGDPLSWGSGCRRRTFSPHARGVIRVHKQMEKVKEAQKELNEAKEGVKDAKKKVEIAASKKTTAYMNDWQKIEYYSHLMSKRKLNAEEIKEAKEVAKKWIQANPYHVQKNGKELYQKGVDAHEKAIYGTKEEAQSVRVAARGEGRPDQSIYTKTAWSVENQNPITSAVQGFGRGFGITVMGRLLGDASNALNEKIANVTHNPRIYRMRSKRTDGFRLLERNMRRGTRHRTLMPTGAERLRATWLLMRQCRRLQRKRGLLKKPQRRWRRQELQRG